MASTAHHIMGVDYGEASKMVRASKYGDWDAVWVILGKKPHLVNSIPKERRAGILHYAVWRNNLRAVEKILNIPGCDSKLISKNGLNPLDIKSTPQIQQLLHDHVHSNNNSLPEVDQTKDFINKMVLAAKRGDWNAVWEILDEKPHLVNSIPKERAWGILHQAVWWKSLEAVEKILSIPGCDSKLLTIDGVQPLDIKTTPEIKQLLENHIKSKNDSGSCLPLTDDPNDENINEMVLAAKERRWDTVWTILNQKPFFVNLIPKERAWGILHQAVWWQDYGAVEKILNIPGCDSELLTKNGLRPLDIETSPEIEKLLKDHIASNNDSNSEELTLLPEDTSDPKDVTDEEMKEAKVVMREEFGKTWKKNDFNKLSNKLKSWKHLFNTIIPKTGLVPTHEADVARDEKVVTELMSYTACELNVKTPKPPKFAKVNIENTYAEIATNTNIKAAMEESLRKQQKEYQKPPTCVSIESAQLNLMWYVGSALAEYELCESMTDQDYFKPIPEMLHGVYQYVNSVNGWKSVREMVAKEVERINNMEGYEIGKIQDKTDFMQYLITLYTKDNYYGELNSRLRKHPHELPDVLMETVYSEKSCRLYTVVTNAILFHGTLPKLGEPYTGTTYRGMQLSDECLGHYSKVGSIFSWLSFTSATGTEDRAFRMNCIFTIDNATECPWSPRGVKDLAEFPIENEYLYPCGAQFKVTKYFQQNGKHQIHLKLIHSTPDVKTIELIYELKKSDFDKLANEFQQIFPQQKKLLESNKQVNASHSQVENLEKYKKEVADMITKKITLPKGEKAYRCMDCNTTCDYPCSDTHMSLGRCESCVPGPEGACTKCPGKCHFSKHHRVDYKVEVNSLVKKVVDRAMKVKIADAKAKHETQINLYKHANEKFEESISRMPEGTDKLTEMQHSISQQSDILQAMHLDGKMKNSDALTEFAESKLLMEECIFEMSELDLL